MPLFPSYRIHSTCFLAMKLWPLWSAPIAAAVPRWHAVREPGAIVSPGGSGSNKMWDHGHGCRNRSQTKNNCANAKTTISVKKMLDQKLNKWTVLEIGWPQNIKITIASSGKLHEVVLQQAKNTDRRNGKHVCERQPWRGTLCFCSQGVWRLGMFGIPRSLVKVLVKKRKNSQTNRFIEIILWINRHKQNTAERLVYLQHVRVYIIYSVHMNLNCKAGPLETSNFRFMESYNKQPGAKMSNKRDVQRFSMWAKGRKVGIVRNAVDFPVWCSKLQTC